MLRLEKLYPQFASLVQAVQQERLDESGAIRRLAEHLQMLSATWERWAQRGRTAKSSWLIGVPLEDPASRFELDTPPDSYAVATCDGSQIMPDRHGFVSCYVINLGKVILRYGSHPQARLESEPHLRWQHRPAWLPPQSLTPEEQVTRERDLAELQTLIGLAKEAAQAGDPTVALADGSLIHWPYDLNRAEDVEMVQGLRAALQEAQQAQIPVGGYISGSHARDVIHFLRLVDCPYSQVDCDTCSYLQARQQPPCAENAEVLDTTFFAHWLRPGQRSALFASQSRVLSAYGDQAIVFCYLHCGEEVARIEMPQWVAADTSLRDRLLTVALDQARKGRGYPIALAEAHEQAVVRAADRAAFLDQLAHLFVVEGLPVQTSVKSLRKRSRLA